MNSRSAQDVLLRLLSDAPYRAATRKGLPGGAPSEVWDRLDHEGVERFARFLTRHYYRERIVHLFKYSRALSAWTGRPPELVLKSDKFESLMPRAVLGSRETAEAVAALLRDQQLENSDGVREQIPYWADLVEYQCLFFVTDALPLPEERGVYPRRAGHAAILEIAYDLPAVLTDILHADNGLPVAEKRPVWLLFSRSQYGPVSVSTCSPKLQEFFRALDGAMDPMEAGRVIGLSTDATRAALHSLAQLGAVIPGSF